MNTTVDQEAAKAGHVAHRLRRQMRFVEHAASFTMLACLSTQVVAAVRAPTTDNIVWTIVTVAWAAAFFFLKGADASTFRAGYFAGRTCQILKAPVPESDEEWRKLRDGGLLGLVESMSPPRSN